MDAKTILDELMNSGKQLVKQSANFAEKNLGLPPEGEKRDAMLSGLGKGALAGGLLAVLLGTKTGRKASGKLLKYGSLAAMAAVAYKAYQTWQNSSPSATATGKSIGELSGDEANSRGLLLLRTMIAAANADGHIDETERAAILEQLAGLGLADSAARLLQQELTQPLDATSLAKQVDSTAAATEVYLLSSSIIDEANPQEQAYLNQLSSALNLPSELRLNLDQTQA